MWAFKRLIMLIFKTVKELQYYLKTNNFLGIGFVPTMGALHQGHLSLIKASQQQNELTVCSIFVNPTQFNKQEDLINYPRNVAADIGLLESVLSTNPSQKMVLFLPTENEIYPKKSTKKYDFKLLSRVMEAKHRPGHFDGVAMVIERFFTIIHPNYAYFGEKDFQQLAVVCALTEQLKLSVHIVGCAIVREQNGLAMSSRNERLSIKEKEEASIIFRLLTYAKQRAKQLSILELKNYVASQLAATKRIELEYFELADGKTLEPVLDWNTTSYCVAFIAVTINNVRLIDNMTLFRV